MCNQSLKQFRTIEGDKRREAMRAHLAQAAEINFAASDPHALTVRQQSALVDMARAVCWRKSAASPLSLGMAFYVYLARGMSGGHAQAADVQGIELTSARRAFKFGKGH